MDKEFVSMQQARNLVAIGSMTTLKDKVISKQKKATRIQGCFSFLLSMAMDIEPIYPQILNILENGTMASNMVKVNLSIKIQEPLTKDSLRTTNEKVKVKRYIQAVMLKRANG